MKLLYITNARIPTEKAHGIQVMKMCEAFAKRIETVELIIPARTNEIKQDAFEYYGVSKNFKIKRLPCLDLIFLDKYIGHFALWIESASFVFFAFFYLLFSRADIIYTRDIFFLFISPFWRSFIFEIHAFPRKYFLYDPFFERVKNIVVITEQLKKLFVERDIEPLKILVAADGADIQKFSIFNSQFSIREKLGLPQDRKIALYTGHLYSWKGADTLLEAARNFQFSIFNFQFVFVGGTQEDIESFKNKAKDLSNVLIVGHRPHTEIPFWLKAADVLVLPNSAQEEISKHWTSPLKMFEYMASGTPIVASDLPSVREVLNESNAVLVAPDNANVLAEGIKEALRNSQKSDKISAKALKDVKQYSWDKRAEKICQKIF